MEPLSNELVLAVVVAAVLVGIYLLRHIIALAVKLIVFAALVLALVWMWQHRAEIVDAAEPYLGPVGDRIGRLNLSDVRDLLVDLLSGQDPGAAEDPGMTDITGILEDPEEPDVPREPDGSEGPGAREDRNDPDDPE